MTLAASAVTGTSLNTPPNPPTGVLRGSQMTASRTSPPYSAEQELAAGHDHGRPAHLHPLDALGRAGCEGVQQRGPLDLPPLAELDLIAEADASVAAQMH